MSTTDAQRLAQAEASARRWFLRLEAAAATTMSDEVFSVIHCQWRLAERAVVLQRELNHAPPSSRRS